MASDLTAVVNNGTLWITSGDDQDSVRIVGTMNPGEFTVIGGTNYDSSTTLVNGVAQRTFTGVTKSVAVWLEDGDNQVIIEDVKNISVSVNTGDGNDDISIGKYVAIPLITSNEPTVVIKNSLSIDSGKGDDTIFVGRVFGTNNHNFLFRLDTQQGDDVVNLYNLNAASLIWNGGAGDDQINIGFTWITRYWSMRGDGGNDLINIYCSKTAQHTLIEGGFGDDTLAMDTIQSHVDVKVNMDTLDHADSAFGDDSVLLARSVISGILINVGEGKNNVTIGKYYDYDAENNLVLRDGGCIAERVLFNIDSYTDNTFVMAASLVANFTYNGAGGNDTVDLRNNVFEEYYVYGGLFNSGGNDTLIRRYNSHTVAATAVGFVEE